MEKLGYLEPVSRMPNQYRVFNEHHIYQIQVCSLVFGGFVNTRLRKISMHIIAAAKGWDLEAYDRATQNYLQAVEQDITRTKKAVFIVTKQINQIENDEIRRMYVIRLLLDTGYSCMAILRFLTAYDDGLNQKATRFLLGTVEDAELQSRADQYLQSLYRARTQADTLCHILTDMKKI